MPHIPYQPRSTPVSPQMRSLPEQPMPVPATIPQVPEQTDYPKAKPMPVVPTYSLTDYAPTVAEIMQIWRGGV